jgi:hypothetical protein
MKPETIHTTVTHKNPVIKHKKKQRKFFTTFVLLSAKT